MNSTTINVLVIQPLMDELAKRLSDRFICHNLYEHRDIDHFLSQHGKEIRAVATRGDVGLDAELMARLPNLEIISVFGVGTDGIDLKSAAKRNIIVAITSDTLTDDVADLAMGLVIATSRQLITQDKFARSGGWLTASPALASKVSGKKLGILGLGKIGKAIAKRAAAFDMPIGYCDQTDQNIENYHYFPSVIALADSCDFLVLALPGGEANKGMINIEVLRALGAKGTLINIARGSLVNEADLIIALKECAIKGAGLDVYNNEPHIPEELLTFDNVVITPHIASATTETRINMAQIVYDNLDSYFTNGNAITPINLNK